MTRPLLVRFVSIVGTAVSFYLLLAPGRGPVGRGSRRAARARLIGPAVIFSATTMAVGIVVTFLPLAITGTRADVAALALR